ncbi:MAG: PPOX class probable F420-dependent enzyme [Nitriliruptoraceae bacterium]|jgi:PPOX class probable F420-dependent enzyme
MGMRVQIDDARRFVQGRTSGALAVVDGDGYPHVSQVAFVWDHDMIRISVTQGRVKTRLLRAHPKATLHVLGDDVWHWVSLVGDVTLSAIATSPDDPTCDELLRTYEAVAGAHDDPDEFRAAMVADHRVVLRLDVQQVYGQL